jgi:hypothetical protein
MSSKQFAPFKYKWTSDSPNSSTPGMKPVHEVKPMPIAQSGRLDAPQSPGNTSIAAVMDAANRPDSPKHPVDSQPVLNIRTK